MSTKLHIARRSDDWHCQLEHRPEVWSCGKSPAEAIGNWVLDHGKEHNVHAAMMPTQQQLFELARLERAIYDEGVDGGAATSAAIGALRSAEWRYGVFDPNAETPRWNKP